MTHLPADRWQRLDGLLDEALARPPDARTAYLRTACRGDPELYREALALLQSTDTAARALGESAVDFAAPRRGGGKAPAAPPMTMFCGVARFSHME